MGSSYRNLYVGCSSQQALMSGCNMCGTQVEVQIIYKTDRRQNIYRVFPRKRNLPPNRVPLAPFCLHRSCHSSQGKGSVMLNIHSNISPVHHSLIIYFLALIFPLSSGRCRSTSCTSMWKIFLSISTSAAPLLLTGGLDNSRNLKLENSELENWIYWKLENNEVENLRDWK